MTMCFSCRGKASSEAFQTVGDFAPFKDTSEASVDLVMKRNLLNLDSCALAAFHYLAVKISRSVGTYPNTEAFLSFFFFLKRTKDEVTFRHPQQWKRHCWCDGRGRSDFYFGMFDTTASQNKLLCQTRRHQSGRAHGNRKKIHPSKSKYLRPISAES